VTDFAAAVAAARAAVAAFDRGEPVPRAEGAPTVVTAQGQRVEFPGLNMSPDDLQRLANGTWLDWNAIREPAVLAEEAALERDFGCGTRSAGGGGEPRGRAPAREMPTADFRPKHARVRDALRKLGTATAREITVEAKTSHAAGGWLTEALKRGEVEHDGGYPRRYRWVGPAPLAPADRELAQEAVDLMAGGLTLRKVCERFRAERRKLAGREVTPAWLTKAMRMNGERNAAPSAPQEVEKMPTGTKITEEAVLAAMDNNRSNTAEGIAERLKCKCDPVESRLRALRKAGRVTSTRGPGKGGPMVWTVGGSKPTGMRVHAAAAKKAKLEIDAYRHPEADGNPLAAMLTREIDRQAMLRAAAILRAHADAIEAEAGSAA